MNRAVYSFVYNNVSKEEVTGRRIIEVGSQNVNGSVRPIFTQFSPGEYLGVDFQEGKGVDLVCDVNDIIEKFGEKSFDIVVSTEMLEHVIDWPKVISNLKRLLKNGGLLFLSTRSRGFPYHGYPYDFWRYEIEDFKEIFSDMNIMALAKDNSMPGVLLKAIKPTYFQERNLANVPLYSMIAEKKIYSFSENDLKIINSYINSVDAI